jgi:Zn-dependent protease with chaperone function
VTAPLIIIPIALEWVILVTTLAPIFLPSRRLFLKFPNLGLFTWFAALLSAGVAALAASSVMVWSIVETWVALDANPAGSPTWFAVFWASFAPWLVLAAAGISLAVINLRIEPLVVAAKQTQPLFEGALRPVQNFMGVEVLEMPLPIAVAFTRNRQIILSSVVREVLTDGQFEAVLFHELAHIRGNHNALKKLAGFVRLLSPQLAASKALVVEVDRLCELAADKRALREVDAQTLQSARRIFEGF